MLELITQLNLPAKTKHIHLLHRFLLSKVPMAHAFLKAMPLLITVCIKHRIGTMTEVSFKYKVLPCACVALWVLFYAFNP